jgi:hypothetical protein
MVLLTDVYRNVTSLRVNRLRICYEFLKKQCIKVELQCLEPGNGGLNNLNAGPQCVKRIVEVNITTSCGNIRSVNVNKTIT